MGGGTGIRPLRIRWILVSCLRGRFSVFAHANTWVIWREKREKGSQPQHRMLRELVPWKPEQQPHRIRAWAVISLGQKHTKYAAVLPLTWALCVCVGFWGFIWEALAFFCLLAKRKPSKKERHSELLIKMAPLEKCVVGVSGVHFLSVSFLRCALVHRITGNNAHRNTFAFRSGWSGGM